MKILWLTVDRSHRVAQQFDIFRSYVEKIADVVVLKKSVAGDKGQNMWQLSKNLISGDIKSENIVFNHLTEIDDNYDFIFCDAFFAYLDEDWKHFGIPSGIFIEDIHQIVPRIQIEKAKEYGIENIFHRFNFSFHKFHPKARKYFKCFWLPHSINDERILNNSVKDIEVLHIGVCPQQYYPYRADAVNQLSYKTYFKQVVRPKEGGERSNKWPIDNEYTELLGRSHICITGGSIFNAPVQKYVEIPAANTLLMSNWFADLGLLGFVPGKNMVTYEQENLISIIEKLLKDKDKIYKISNEGYILITTKHTSKIRSKQFINNICQIINKPIEFPDIEPCSFQVNFKYSKVITKHISRKKIIYKRLKHIIGITTESCIEIKKPNIKNKRDLNTDWRSRIK